jgi:ribosome-associated translation inhibitor RaiA
MPRDFPAHLPRFSGRKPSARRSTCAFAHPSRTLRARTAAESAALSESFRGSAAGTFDAGTAERKGLGPNMGLPLRITFRDLDRSDAIEASIRRHAEKLLTYEARIRACDVAVEAPHRHKHHGRHYRVRVSLVVPGAELVADRNPDAARLHEDVYAAVDDAFDHAARLLRDRVGRKASQASASRERQP